MKIIELTLQCGTSVYLNAKYIVSVFRIPQISRLEYKGSYVTCISGGEAFFEVRETPEQIIELIKTL
jgi:hypothetical protein